MTQHQAITCQQFIGTLDDYLGGVLTDEGKNDAEGHLLVCRSCVAYLDSYRRTIALEKSLSRDDPHATLPEDLADRIDRGRRE